MKSFKKKKHINSFKVTDGNEEIKLEQIKEEKITKQKSLLEKSRSQSKIKQIKIKKNDSPFKTKKKSNIFDHKVADI